MLGNLEGSDIRHALSGTPAEEEIGQSETMVGELIVQHPHDAPPRFLAEQDAYLNPVGFSLCQPGLELDVPDCAAAFHDDVVAVGIYLAARNLNDQAATQPSLLQNLGDEDVLKHFLNVR